VGVGTNITRAWPANDTLVPHEAVQAERRRVELRTKLRQRVKFGTLYGRRVIGSSLEP
jgi:hypothetical protein